MVISTSDRHSGRALSFASTWVDAKPKTPCGDADCTTLNSKKTIIQTVKNQIKNKTVIALIAVAALSVASFQLHGAAEVKPKYTTKQIMKALNKGETNVGKKVGKGEGTKADFAKLLEYYQYLPLNEPPQGDKVGWN